MQMQTTLQREIAFLHGLTDRNAAGQVFPGEAFGIGSRVLLYVESEAMRSKDYNFTISLKGDVLELEVDTYMAIHGTTLKQGEFDLNAWDAGKIIIDSALPPGRQAYDNLHRAARMLLAGYDVRLADGTPGGVLVQGIKRGADHGEA